MTFENADALTLLWDIDEYGGGWIISGRDRAGGINKHLLHKEVRIALDLSEKYPDGLYVSEFVNHLERTLTRPELRLIVKAVHTCLSKSDREYLYAHPVNRAAARLLDAFGATKVPDEPLPEDEDPDAFDDHLRRISKEELAKAL
jgi:hypothetical protein